jgi:tyrosine-protein kinase Etk/Wzc
MAEKYISNDFLSSIKEEDEIDLGKIFRFLLMQSKLILSIVFVTLILSCSYYFFATKQYEVKSLIQYEAFDQNIFDPSQSIRFASGANATSDITDMIQLYESRTNYLKVIKDLKLNIRVEGLEDDEDVNIYITSGESDLLQTQKLKFSFSANGYSLLDDNLNEVQKSEYGQQILFNGLKIVIESSNLRQYRPVDVYYKNPESMYNSFKSRMNISTSSSTRNSFFKNEGLITITYITDDIDLGKAIINYSNDIFLNQRIFEESQKSRKAISFIDQNIKSIEQSVEINKIKLKQFREENKSIDVSLEIEGIIKKIQALDEALSSIEIELAKAEEIYTSNNPVYLNLKNEKKLIEAQKEQVLSEIEMMPREQQEYIDLFNNLEVSQTLFEELESRRLGFSILEASTIGDVRVVDKAYVNYLVSPQLISVILSAVIAFIAGCFIAFFRGLYFLPISNPAEIFDNHIHTPIIGVVPGVDFEDPAEQTKLNTAIESLLVNINSLQDNKKDKNIITITSPSAGNGKSTISMKLAEGLSKIGKKVLLVDNDLKRGNLAKNYSIKSISEETFYSINESTIDKYMVNDNLFLIPRVKGLSNTFQFLYSIKYNEKIKFFKDHFDYVIFDTGPILAVSDTSILVEKSDFNILVTRHGVNKVNEIRQCLENYKQISKNIDGLIYNAYAKPEGYYGYYSLYGNYSYQYYADKYLEDAYEYEKKD